MKILIYILLVVGSVQSVLAQKKVTVTFEDIKQQCKDIAPEKRVRLTVARFSVSTPTAPDDFGDNLATMLANALQGVNCYNVLESLKNKEDMNAEIEYSQSGYSKTSTAPKKGNQLGAQVVITGEITEYNAKTSGVRVGLVKVGSSKTKLGFILKMVNPETREVLFSESINVEGKVGGATEFGLLGVNMVKTANNDPALANACEQGIIQAVEFLASKKDELHLPEVANPAAGTNETLITVNNLNYTAFNALATILTNLTVHKSVEKSLSSGTATYTLSHTGSSDDVLNELSKKIAGTYEVIGFDKGRIELKVK